MKDDQKVERFVSDLENQLEELYLGIPNEI
jgi:hypothetical protein